MLHWIKMRIFSEIMGMRICFLLSLFIVLSFFFSGLFCAAGLSETARSRVLLFLFGSEAAVFSIYLALLWKRALLLTLTCLSGFFFILFPLCLCFMLMLELTLGLAWGCMLTGFLRSAAILPFLLIPMVVFLFYTTRSLAYILKYMARQLRERRIPKTGMDLVMDAKETVYICLTSLAGMLLAGAAEAIVAAIAL